MYTLVFKFKGENGIVFDVYHTDGQVKQRVIGNIYCSSGSVWGNSARRDVTSSNKDLINFHTLAESTEYEISGDILEKLYKRAEQICDYIWGVV